MKFTSPVAIILASSIFQNSLGFLSQTQLQQYPTTIPSKSESTKTTLLVADFLQNALEEPIPTEHNSLESLRKITFSKALPFLKRPPLLDGELPGDVGFDPLELAKSKQDLYKYREAEVKHGRLAMLASVAWPFSDMLYYQQHHHAPSPFDGVQSIGSNDWFIIVVISAFVESFGMFKSMNRVQDPSYFPGNLGFDPFDLYPYDDEIQGKVMQLAEIKHGRVAMVAVLIHAMDQFYQ